MTFLIAVAGAEDIMLNYQSLSFHDILYLRQVQGRRPAPEFEAWLQAMGIIERTEPFTLSQTMKLDRLLQASNHGR